MDKITKAVAIIPARGGSKRIPRKNIKDFCGKPMIAYSIKAAFESGLFNKILVSTDDEEIAKVATSYGAEVPFLRPAELSDDYIGTGAVVSHAIKWLKQNGYDYDYVCTIYATAPLIQAKYIIEGFEKLQKSDSCVAFSVTSMPFPIQRTFKINSNGRCEMFWPENFSRRSQDLEEAYQDAGQFYWRDLRRQMNDITFGKDSIPIILPRHLVQDIDTMEDWRRAEYMYQAINKDIYDNWNKLKKILDTKQNPIHIRNMDILFISIGQNIGYEAYGKDELFLRPVLVYKKLTRTTFLGIPLTSKEKEGNYYFKFSYKDNKYSYASLNQIRTFDTKRIAYKSGTIKSEDFEILKKQVEEFVKITPHSKESGRGITSKKKQRSNEEIVPKDDENVK